jgi:hypothetical protein
MKKWGTTLDVRAKEMRKPLNRRVANIEEEGISKRQYI